MNEIAISADKLIGALLRLSLTERVCILDSCGVSNLGSHLLIAGLVAVETLEISYDDPEETLKIVDEALSGDLACIFTLSYDFGMKMLGIMPRLKKNLIAREPDVFISTFDALIVHDYNDGRTYITGDSEKFDEIRAKLSTNSGVHKTGILSRPTISSNFTRPEYLAAIETIKEHIRSGVTYQTNLTQQLTAILPDDLSPQDIFYRLRRDHPAPFAAFINRPDSTVISASPERFIKISRDASGREYAGAQRISTSPIKGTRPRGKTADEDTILRKELLASSKDRAENTMIVDLLRNDLGRVCEYGSISVEKLCDLEEHPTFFNLVSTITGDLKKNIRFTDVLKAVFPCGSITGAPKISTMKIIDRIETATRGLSMGAIGYYIPGSKFSFERSILDLSVAIRTMVVRGNTATFNVGGGIVIDSDPEMEYDETLTKAKALLRAIGADLEFPR
ncbi:MAG: anthranilate synthase component I family protein [Pyrinomonadaceae bacterium]